MVAPPLVEPYVAEGRQLIEELDARGFDVQAALWRYFSEPNEWRLLIASSLVDRLGPKETYRKLQGIVKSSHVVGRIPSLSLSEISVVSPKDDFIELLRKAVRTGTGVSQIRFTGNTINGTFVEDALIYRL